LIIVRSMSKHCGVPGLRLGYCYSANDQFLERMRYLLPTWNINTVAEYLLTLLPPTDEAYHVARRRLIDDVQWFYDQLCPMERFYVYPTGANFVLIRVENGMTAHELQMLLLREYRLYVRDCTNKRGMDAYHIRVASQGREKDRRLVDALRELDRRSPAETHS
jgi:histidinol-phosphate/aromatic aminotransferase/cobyric acid decarboxylase-like protein